MKMICWRTGKPWKTIITEIARNPVYMGMAD